MFMSFHQTWCAIYVEPFFERHVWDVLSPIFYDFLKIMFDDFFQIQTPYVMFLCTVFSVRSPVYCLGKNFSERRGASILLPMRLFESLACIRLNLCLCTVRNRRLARFSHPCVIKTSSSIFTIMSFLCFSRTIFCIAITHPLRPLGEQWMSIIFLYFFLYRLIISLYALLKLHLRACK